MDRCWRSAMGVKSLSAQWSLSSGCRWDIVCLWARWGFQRLNIQIFFGCLLMKRYDWRVRLDIETGSSARPVRHLLRSPANLPWVCLKTQVKTMRGNRLLSIAYYTIRLLEPQRRPMAMPTSFSHSNNSPPTDSGSNFPETVWRKKPTISERTNRSDEVQASLLYASGARHCPAIHSQRWSSGNPCNAPGGWSSKHVLCQTIFLSPNRVYAC